jgi:HEAT repeat protein
MSNHIRMAFTAALFGIAALLLLPVPTPGQVVVAVTAESPATPVQPSGKATATKKSSTGNAQKKQSVEELLKQIDTIRENTAHSKGRKKPAGSARTERTLHVMFRTSYLGSYYANSPTGGARYARFLASELVFVNNTKQPITIKRDQILLKSDDQTLKLQDIPTQIGYQLFQVNRKSYQLRTLKLLKELIVPAGKSASGWVAFTGIPQGSSVPRLVLEMNKDGQRTEWNINEYTLGMLDLKVERIGPRGSLGLLTIAGRLNTVNLGSLISALDRWAADNVARAVIRWTDSAEEVDTQLLSWLKQGAALAGSGNSINNPQMPIIAPASMHELHLAHIPKYNSSRRRTTSSSVRNSYGRYVQIDIESRVHKTDMDAVSAALVSAYRNLHVEEVIREIETGHPLTRAAAIAGGGSRLPVENLPVLLEYADHKDPRFQKAALVALGHFGQTEAIEKLIALTQYSDSDLVRVATESLAASRYSAAHHALLDVLKSEKSPSKKVIITALARFPRSLWSETIYEIASEFNSETCVEALRALARIGHPELTDLYRRALQHSNTKLRDEAFKLLLTRTDPESERMALEFTLNHLKKSPPTSQMSTLLTKTKNSRAVPMLLKHFRESKGSNSTVTNLLAQIGDQSVAGVFVEMYPQLKQSSSKTTVLTALQKLRSPSYRKLAGQALYDKNTSLVSTACRTLQSDGSPEAIRMLLEAFEKVENRSTWRYMANALGTIATPEAREALLKTRSSKNTWKHSTVVNAIRNLQKRSPGYQSLSQGQNYSKQKQWDQAVNSFSLAIKTDPQLSEAYSGRALAYITKGGKGTEARADFAQAEKLDPYNVKAVAYSALMMADVADGEKYKAALKKSEQSRKRFLNDNDFAFQSARLYGKAAKWAIKDKKLSEDDRRSMAEKYRKKSMEELQRAFKLGFKNKSWANTTTDLEPIRNLPEFKKLVGPAKTKSKQSSRNKSNLKKAAPAAVLPAPVARKSR